MLCFSSQRRGPPYASHLLTKHAHAGKTNAFSINSCLCPVGALDGAAITTAEGLGNSLAGFHPVQGELSPVCPLAKFCHFTVIHVRADGVILAPVERH